MSVLFPRDSRGCSRKCRILPVETLNFAVYFLEERDLHILLHNNLVKKNIFLFHCLSLTTTTVANHEKLAFSLPRAGKHFIKLPILGDPGASSRDEGIFVGERLLQQGDEPLDTYSYSKLLPTKIPSSPLAAPGSPRMQVTLYKVVLFCTVEFLFIKKKRSFKQNI